MASRLAAVTDLDLAAVLIAGLAAYRVGQVVRLLRRADRDERAVRYRDTYRWPVDATQCRRHGFAAGRNGHPRAGKNPDDRDS